VRQISSLFGHVVTVMHRGGFTRLFYIKNANQDASLVAESVVFFAERAELFAERAEPLSSIVIPTQLVKLSCLFGRKRLLLCNRRRNTSVQLTLAIREFLNDNGRRDR
jgi:hypothetical protein